MALVSKKKGAQKTKAKPGKDGKSKASGGSTDAPAKENAAPGAEIGTPSIEVTKPDPQVAPTKPPDGQTAGGQKRASTMVPGPPAEEIFVDGVSGLFFRSGVVKIDCYRVVGHDQKENKETRMATHRMVMPATALQELIQLLQNASNIQRSQAANAKQEEKD